MCSVQLIVDTAEAEVASGRNLFAEATPMCFFRLLSLNQLTLPRYLFLDLLKSLLAGML